MNNRLNMTTAIEKAQFEEEHLSENIHSDDADEESVTCNSKHNICVIFVK